MKKEIPEKTVQRLLLYYRALQFILQQGAKNISSGNLARLLEVKDSQVRKDLSYFGKLGQRGSGYNVLALRDKLAEILEIKGEKKVCIVGMGNLGSALASYKGFESLGFKISAVFDNSEHKTSRKIRGHLCHDIRQAPAMIKENHIKIAILTVPAEAAQETALKLEECGIEAILNFTSVRLSLSKKVKVSNVDLAMELKTLSFFM